MSLNLYSANQQWATRPVDERFWTVEDALEQCKAYADSASEVVMPAGKLALTYGKDGNVSLRLNSEKSAQLTHYSFGQLCRRAGAPADYLRKLSAPVAVAALKEGLNGSTDEPVAGDDEKQFKILIHQNGRTIARAMTSEKYSRVWNWQVFEKLVKVQENGWRTPPARPAGDSPFARPATKADVLNDRQGGGGLSVKVGDMIAPAGVYASDHDMFAFMVNEDRRLDDGSAGGLSRGFFVSNSEVGAGSLKVTYFLYRHVCGNHIVWGAENVVDLNVRHVGEAWGRFEGEIQPRLTDFADRAARDDESQIKKAMKFSLGKTADEVLDTIFGLLPRRNGLPSGMNKRIITQAIADGEQLETIDGSPYTLWGFTNALTRMSQATPYTDDRVFLDRFAGQLVTLALAS
jgi:hypothetical protein